MNACPNGHIYGPGTFELRFSTTRGRSLRQCLQCKEDRAVKQRAVRQRKRAADNARRQAEGLHPVRRGVPPHGRLITWETKHWLGDDGRLYATAEAVEYERANEDLFRLNATRALTKGLKVEGFEKPGPAREWWEVVGEPRRDWATLLPMTMTVRTVRPVLDAAQAA